MQFNLFKFATAKRFFNLLLFCVSENYIFYFIPVHIQNIHYYQDRDRAERHDLKSRLWLFFSHFQSPPKQREEENENE